MRITMAAKNFTITEPMRVRVEKKLNKMDRYFREEAEAQVRLSQERNVRFIAEMTLMVGGVMFRAEEESDDMYAAIDRALDRLDRQVHRHRTKLGSWCASSASLSSPWPWRTRSPRWICWGTASSCSSTRRRASPASSIAAQTARSA